MALMLGALASLALPPYYWLPVLWLSFPGLALLIARAESARQAWLQGWLFGFGYFLFGLYWLTEAFSFASGGTEWLALPALLGLAAGLGSFTGLAGWLTWVMRPPAWLLPVLLAAAWTGSEWLRGHLLGGFPWNLIGSAWIEIPQIRQLAALIGGYGMSLFTVLISAGAMVLFTTSASTRRDRYTVLATLLILTGGAWYYGGEHLIASKTEDVPDVRLRLVQGNIPQALKWQPAQRAAILEKYLALSRSKDLKGITHVIWPESALPDDLDKVSARLTTAIPEGGLLLTGAVILDAKGTESRISNSLIALDDQGRLRGRYDKLHLVPFGEYVPFRDLLPVRKLTVGSVDFTPGESDAPLELPGLPSLRPLICYEAIFPGHVIGESWPRPQWLLNISNDAWFGTSIGPYQHFASARLRAVEEGLPLIRVANTGISAAIDPGGRIIAQLGLNETGILDIPLIKPLSGRTPYSQWGDLPVLLFCSAVVLLAAFRRSRQQRRRAGLTIIRSWR